MRVPKRMTAMLAGVAMGVGSLVLVAPPAKAETVLMECDEVAGTVKTKPALAFAPANAVHTMATSRSGPGRSSECTADPGTPWAAVAGAGTVSVKGKFSAGFTDSTKAVANGGTSCNGLLNTYPANGKLKVRYGETDPNGRVYQSQAYVRLIGTDEPVLRPDRVTVQGTVIKGVGLGASLDAELLMQPLAGEPQASLDDPITAATSFSGISDGSTTAGGVLAAGRSSMTYWGLCNVDGGFTLDTYLFGTDGLSLAAYLVDFDISAALAWLGSCTTEPECADATDAFVDAYEAAYTSGPHRLDSSIKLSLPS